MIKHSVTLALVVLGVALPASARPQRTLEGFAGIKWGATASQATAYANRQWSFDRRSHEGAFWYKGKFAGYNAAIVVHTPKFPMGMAFIGSQAGKTSSQIFVELVNLLSDKYGEYTYEFRTKQDGYEGWGDDIDYSSNDANWQAFASATYDARAFWNFDNNTQIMLDTFWYSNGTRAVTLSYRNFTLLDALRENERQDRLGDL